MDVCGSFVWCGVKDGVICFGWVRNEVVSVEVMDEVVQF